MFAFAAALLSATLALAPHRARAEHPPDAPTPSTDAVELQPRPEPASDEPDPTPQSEEPDLTLQGEDPDPTPQDEEPDPTPQISAADVIAMTGSDHSNAATRRPERRVMSPEGVHDPFPDRVRRGRPRTAGILLGAGVGLAAASALMARITLLPDCEDERDVTTCTPPDGADIGVRSGRLLGAIGFGAGGAAFGAAGAHELALILQRGTATSLERRRRTAVGLGTTSLVLGVSGVVVGATLLGVGGRRTVALARSHEDQGSGLTPEDLVLLDEMVGHIRIARGGLIALVASPTLVATGIALLVHRPRARQRLTLGPDLTRTRVGLRATVRF